MRSYRAVKRILVLAVCGTGILACEDRRATPLEPTEESRLLVEEGGWTTIDGIEFYVSGGGYYPAAGIGASIWDPKTTGDVWPYAGSINAFFDYRGHGATQSTNWQLEKLSSGDRIAGSRAADFGSSSGIALSPFKKRFSGSFAIDHPYECDLKLSADSEHSAWWIGIAIVASKPYIAPGKWGQTYAYSKMNDRIRECASSEDFTSDGGDCDGDVCDEPEEGTCTECQEWLYFSTSGQYLYNEWECNEVSWSYCQALMT